MTRTAPEPYGLPAAPESPGTTVCTGCGEYVSEYSRTPSGLCLNCSDRLNVGVVADPFSKAFWLLTPRAMVRAEAEIRRLHAEAERLNAELTASQLREDSPGYIAIVERFFEIERERHLLQLLHAASRQYRRH